MVDGDVRGQDRRRRQIRLSLWRDLQCDADRKTDAGPGSGVALFGAIPQGRWAQTSGRVGGNDAEISIGWVIAVGYGLALRACGISSSIGVLPNLRTRLEPFPEGKPQEICRDWARRALREVKTQTNQEKDYGQTHHPDRTEGTQSCIARG